MAKPIVLTCFILVAASGVAAWIGWTTLNSYKTTALTLEAPQTIEVRPGISLGALVEDLHAQGLITRRLPFRLLVRVTRQFRQFQAGRYRFSGTITPQKIIETIVSGRTHHEQVLIFTIPEGFDLKQITARIQNHPIPDKDQFKSLVRNPALITELGVKAETLEGYLYPATYRFYDSIPNSTAIIRRMVREFFTRLPTDYAVQARERGLSLHEAIIFASLIERETALDRERPFVSEVIWRRLDKRIALGIDAALIYGIRDYDGDIKTIHLRDRSNRYNTRIHRGLPPGPIGSPSLKSLAAVLTPSDFGYYYYVLNPDGSQEHTFSKSLEEHNQHVRKLVQAARNKKKRR